MLLCEYLLLACQKKVTEISLWGECHEDFFSFCLVNFLQMYLSGYHSCNSLWKFIWHKGTMETNSHHGKMLLVFSFWEAYRMFSYCVSVLEAGWSSGIGFGESCSFSSWAIFITLGLRTGSTFLSDSKSVIGSFAWICYVLGNRIWPVSLMAQMVKHLPAVLETQVWSPGREDPLGKGMTTHSSILAWRIPWTEESGGLQSMVSEKVTHDWLT